MDKKKSNLNVYAENKKEYKVEAIYNSAIYTSNAENDLLSIYYPIA